MRLPTAYIKNSKTINVIIETPFKSRNKYAFDKPSGMFRLKRVLPAGLAFPCDMGFIPQTKAGDGDPLDVLVLMSEFTYPGCIIECRVLGAIRATQKEKNEKAVQNDRIIVVPVEMKECRRMKDLEDIGKNMIKDLINFFENYNAMDEKQFKVLSLVDQAEAHKIIKEGM
jgi:inorganic pyrophosphatase